MPVSARSMALVISATSSSPRVQLVAPGPVVAEIGERFAGQAGGVPGAVPGLVERRAAVPLRGPELAPLRQGDHITGRAVTGAVAGHVPQYRAAVAQVVLQDLLRPAQFRHRR